MSGTNAAENNESGAAPKSKKKLIIIILALLLVGGGVGGFFYMRKASAAAAAEKEASEKKGKEHSDDEEASDEPEDSEESDGGKNSSGDSITSAIPEDEEVKKVIELQPFIVNLADENESRYLRLTISVGIGEAGESEKPDELFMTRVRNAIIAVLTTKKSEEVLTVEGKAALRKQILKAAKKASEEPKVLAIYITDFIVQM